MFARRLAVMSSRRLGRQKNVTLKTSSVRLHQGEYLLGTNYNENESNTKNELI